MILCWNSRRTPLVSNILHLGIALQSLVQVWLCRQAARSDQAQHSDFTQSDCLNANRLGEYVEVCQKTFWHTMIIFQPVCRHHSSCQNKCSQQQNAIHCRMQWRCKNCAQNCSEKASYGGDQHPISVGESAWKGAIHVCSIAFLSFVKNDLGM